MPHERFANLGTVGLAEVRKLEVKHRSPRKQLVLAAEIADDHCRVDVGDRGNFADCRELVTLSGKQLLGCGKDGRAGTVCLAWFFRFLVHAA